MAESHQDLAIQSRSTDFWRRVRSRARRERQGKTFEKCVGVVIALVGAFVPALATSSNLNFWWRILGAVVAGLLWWAYYVGRSLYQAAPLVEAEACANAATQCGDSHVEAQRRIQDQADAAQSVLMHAGLQLEEARRRIDELEHAARAMEPIRARAKRLRGHSLMDRGDSKSAAEFLRELQSRHPHRFHQGDASAALSRTFGRPLDLMGAQARLDFMLNFLHAETCISRIPAMPDGTSFTITNEARDVLAWMREHPE